MKETKDIKISRYEEELSLLLIENQALVNEKIRAEQFNQMKSTFLANMSHELRTPMHAILSFSKLSLKKLGVLEKSQLMENLQIIHRNGQRLLHTLNDILDVSKLEAGQMDFKFVQANMCAEIDAIIKEFQSMLLDKNISYKLNFCKQPHIADFDTNRIAQVMQNLLGNAIKFSPSCGLIEIQLKHSKLENEEALSVSISDQGIGVPPNELEMIFDKYVQSTRGHSYIGGTGLGLSISKKIIEAHAGKIWATINATTGSTFHFTIPIKQQESYAKQSIEY